MRTTDRVEAAFLEDADPAFLGRVERVRPDDAVAASLDASRSNTNGIYSFNNAAKNDVYSGVIHFGSPGSAHLDIAGRQNRSVYNFPTDFTGAQVDSSQWTTSRLTVASVDGGFYMGKKVEFRVLAAGTQNQSTSQRLQESGADTVGVFYVDPSTTKQWSIDARLAIHANASTAITLGGEYDDQQIKSSDSSFSSDFNDTSSFAHSRTNTAYYANATGDIGSKFSYNAGIRITNSDLFGTNTSYRVGAGYVLLPKTIIRGSIGSAFNEPSFYEQYSTGFTTGNPDLKPETGMSWEIGLQQSISDGRGVMGVTYFSQKFTNMIQYDPGRAVRRSELFEHREGRRERHRSRAAAGSVEAMVPRLRVHVARDEGRGRPLERRSRRHARPGPGAAAPAGERGQREPQLRHGEEALRERAGAVRRQPRGRRFQYR